MNPEKLHKCFHNIQDAVLVKLLLQQQRHVIGSNLIVCDRITDFLLNFIPKYRT